MDVDDILSRADRLCLEVARERGSLEAVLCKEGREDDEECAMFEHFKAMAKEGLLEHVGARGTRSHRQGAEFVVQFMPTKTGLRLLEAAEEIERLQAQLEGQKEKPRSGKRGSVSHAAG